MPFSPKGAQVAVNAVLGFAPSASRWISLYQGDPTAAGVEVTALGRPAVAFNDAGATDKTTESSTAEVFTNNTASAITGLTHFVIWDVASAGTFAADGF